MSNNKNSMQVGISPPCIEFLLLRSYFSYFSSPE